jgi:glycosyltransferase involved in cell wall biosynthesis
MEPRPITVGYVYEDDAQDPTVQSGYPRAILNQLRVRGVRVVEAFPLDRRAQRRFLWKKVLYRAGGKIYRTDREPGVLRCLAIEAARRIHGKGVDCVFAPGSHAVAFLDIPVPKVFLADATFRNVLDFYEDFTHCAAEYVRQGDTQDRLALQTSAAAIYTSQWGADSAVRDYGADPSKIYVVPFGANIDAPHGKLVRAAVAAKPRAPLRILFIGREWRRKGLPKVIETCEWITAQGIPIQLDVIGAANYPGPRPRFARFHGFLSRAREADCAKIRRLLAEAHLLFAPSQADNTPIAFCEAAAYGLPVITTGVGGIPSVVRHGETGFFCPPDAPPEAFGQCALALFSEPARYQAMALQSRTEYETRLNWEAFGNEVIEILRRCVDGQGA